MSKQLIYYLAIVFVPLSTFAQTNTFPSSGNVGLGTTTPQSKLHILQVGEDYDSGIKIVGSTSPISGRLWMAGERLHIDNATAGSGSGFTLSKEGSIGLGTSSPLSFGNYKILDIQGTSSSSGGYIRLATSNSSGEARIFAINNGLLFEVQKPNMYFQWRNANGEQLYRLNQDGSARWEGNALSRTDIGSNAYGPFIMQYGNNGDSLSWIIRGYAYTNDVQAEFNKGGINVNGTVRSKQVTVTMEGWSDYVFKDDYHLRPLEELNDYIQANKHLPDIPSEIEVESAGLNLGEMNAMLLKKIEELTLYTIEQHKQIKELQQSKHLNDLQRISFESRIADLEKYLSADKIQSK